MILVSEPTYAFCKVCDGGCSLVVEPSDNGGLVFHGAAEDPITGGHNCSECHNDFEQALESTWHELPMRRTSDGLVAVEWDDALNQIAAALKPFAKQKQLGMHLGPSVCRSTPDLIQALSFAAAVGVTEVSSEQCAKNGPKLQFAEWMIGHAAELLSDLGRAHYVLLLGSDPQQGHWGQPGMAYAQQLQHSRKTKKTRVVSVSSVKGPFSKTIDQHIHIRPGSEPFFLLGMLRAICDRGWEDRQFVRDYTAGYQEMIEALKPWTLEVCAERAGLDKAVLSGIALKFSRAAMAVAHPGIGAFNNEHAALGAWAYIALHAVTANLLRPGGIYENRGAFDLYPFVKALSSAGAPAPSFGPPALLMQRPFTVLHDTQVSALLAFGEPPPIPQKDSFMKRLKQFDLLIVGSDAPSWLSEHADWILPIGTPWSRSERQVHTNTALPCYALPYGPALMEAKGCSRDVSAVLRQLVSLIKPGFHRGGWGMHLQMFGRFLNKSDIPALIERTLRFMVNEEITPTPSVWFSGETDRSLWRPTDDRIDLRVDIVSDMLQAPKKSAPQPSFFLRSSALTRRGRTLQKGVENAFRIHPDTGFAEGEKVRIQSDYGDLIATVILDENTQMETIDMPYCEWPQVLNLLPSEACPLTGAPVYDGVSCHLERTV